MIEKDFVSKEAVCTLYIYVLNCQPRDLIKTNTIS